MALADYQPERVTVKFKAGSFQVRGLGLDDITVLMGQHLDDLDHILEMYAHSVDSQLATVATAQYITKLVREAPGLVANVIELASDEPGTADTARRLPISVQVDALQAIGRLTFEEAGGAKKFFESLATLLSGLQVPTITEAMTGSRT